MIASNELASRLPLPAGDSRCGSAWRAVPRLSETPSARIHAEPLLTNKPIPSTMAKPSHVILPLAVMLSTAPPLLGQLFNGDGSLHISFQPGSYSSSFSSAFPSGSDDGSLPGGTAGSASHTADGISAVGSVSGGYAASSGWSSISVSTTALVSYPANQPISEPPERGASGITRAAGQIYFHQLIFSGPSDSTSTQGSLNLLFSGKSDASVEGSTVVNYVYGNVDFIVHLNGALAAPPIAERNGLIADAGVGLQGYSLLAGYTGGIVDVTTGEWTIPIGVPVLMQIDLSSRADAYAQGEFNGEISNEGELWLPLNTPLFNLPEGFTVNSLDGAIVDNIYTAVPEPEQYFALAGAGLALFGLYRRVRRR